MSFFDLEVITPTKTFELEKVSYVKCPGSNGSFGVMAGHRECVISLEPGEVKVTKESKEFFYSISGGYAEISNNRLLLLVEAVEPSAEIDVNRAQSALDRAEKRIKSKNEDLDIIRAENALIRALNRLTISKR